MKRWGILLLLLALAGAAIFVRLKQEPGADPRWGIVMLHTEPNPVAPPVRLQIFSTLRRGDPEPMFAVRPRHKKWLKLETTNETVILSVVDAMRKAAQDGVPWHSPPKDVVTYHIYFELPGSKLPVYYEFYYKVATNEPSSIAAYSTAGNLSNAEGLERWFATNNLLPAPNER